LGTHELELRLQRKQTEGLALAVPLNSSVAAAQMRHGSVPEQQEPHECYVPLAVSARWPRWPDDEGGGRGWQSTPLMSVIQGKAPTKSQA